MNLVRIGSRVLNLDLVVEVDDGGTIHMVNSRTITLTGQDAAEFRAALDRIMRPPCPAETWPDPQPLP